MKIRWVGLRLELNPNLSLPELITVLLGQSGKVWQFAGSTRILTVKELGKYLVGSLVTIKGQRKFAQIDVKSLKMSVQELEKGKNLATFNFFVISKKNLNGLYSYYFASASLPVFGDVVNSLAKGVTDPKKAAALKAVTGKGMLATAQKNTIRETFADAVKCSYLISKQKLAEILEKWERLKALEYTVTHLEPSTQEFGGLKSYIRARTTRLAFEKSSKVASVKSALLKYVNEIKYDRARLEGVDDAGIDRTINLLETPDWFGEEDYGKVLTDTSLFAEDVSQCFIVKLLLKEADEHPEHFDLDVQ